MNALTIVSIDVAERFVTLVSDVIKMQQPHQKLIIYFSAFALLEICHPRPKEHRLVSSDRLILVVIPYFRVTASWINDIPFAIIGVYLIPKAVDK